MTKRVGLDPLEQVLRPIIEGTVRSYLNDHPEVFLRYRPQMIISGIAKRLLPQLCSPEVRQRILKALTDGYPSERQGD